MFKFWIGWMVSKLKMSLFLPLVLEPWFSKSFLINFLPFKIGYLTTFSLKPLSLSQHSNWLHLLSKNLFSEQILFKRRAWLHGIDFLEWYTRQDDNSKYWWVSVGLIYKPVRSLFPLRITSASKRLTSFKEYSAVNFIVGWQLLSIFKNSLW